MNSYFGIVMLNQILNKNISHSFLFDFVHLYKILGVL